MIDERIFEAGWEKQFFDDSNTGSTLTEYEHGRLAGAFAEREKIKSLIDLPEAQADLKTAVDFALSPGATAEGLRAALAKATAPGPGSSPQADTFDTSKPLQPGAYSVDELAKLVNQK